MAQPDLHTLSDSAGLWARVRRQPEHTLLETRFALDIQIAGLTSLRAQPIHLEKMQKSLQTIDAKPKTQKIIFWLIAPFT